MTFDKLLDQAIAMLRKRGRVSYRALKLQLQVDDAQLEVLRGEPTEILQIATDQDNRMLVWAGDAATPAPDAQCEGESRFPVLLPEITGLLQRQGRVTYRRLQYVFGIDDALLAEICDELTFTQLARDVESKGLMWTGRAERVVPSSAEITPLLGRPDASTAPARWWLEKWAEVAGMNNWPRGTRSTSPRAQELALLAEVVM